MSETSRHVTVGNLPTDTVGNGTVFRDGKAYVTDVPFADAERIAAALASPAPPAEPPGELREQAIALLSQLFGNAFPAKGRTLAEATEANIALVAPLLADQAAVKRVEALAKELDVTFRGSNIPDRIRAAIAAPHTEQHTTDEEADRG